MQQAGNVFEYVSKFAILEDTGCKFAEQKDGDQAISVIRKNYCDVVLTDVVMTGIDGFETFKEVKKMDPLVKVIFVTGYALSQAIRQSLQEGAYSVLTKPVNPDDLSTFIKSITGQPSPQFPAIH